MYKSSLFIAILISVVAISFTAKAQSSQVDPGLSTHNYKHPNKAAKARAQKGDEIVVDNIKTIELYSKQQNSKYVSTTPKYAPRATPLVVTRTYQKEGVEINPLTSPRNYKTSNTTERNSSSEVATTKSKADSISYRTID